MASGDLAYVDELLPSPRILHFYERMFFWHFSWFLRVLGGKKKIWEYNLTRIQIKTPHAPYFFDEPCYFYNRFKTRLEDDTWLPDSATIIRHSFIYTFRIFNFVPLSTKVICQENTVCGQQSGSSSLSEKDSENVKYHKNAKIQLERAVSM